MWEKEKMLGTSIFSFSHNIFKRIFTRDHDKSDYGVELNVAHMTELALKSGICIDWLLPLILLSV